MDLIMQKPQDKFTAYQWWKEHNKLYTKPATKNAVWTNEDTGDGSNG